MGMIDEITKLATVLGHWEMHPKLFADLREIIGKDVGTAQRLLNSLTRKLDFLKTYGRDAHMHSTEFERLSHGNSTIYSLHCPIGNKNVRLLYGYSETEEELLLLAFDKKSGKAITDYPSKINAAKQRLNELL